MIDCDFIRNEIQRVIKQDPPMLTHSGGFINDGVDEELDDYRKISYSGKDYLIQIQQREIVNTGISSLKIGFNNVFGYYLEVSNTHKQKVPGDWIRKQTLTNGERYITPELKEYEEKILGAEEKMLKIEWELFDQLLNNLQASISILQNNAQALATLDCYCCFATNATQYNYCKPIIHKEEKLEILKGGLRESWDLKKRLLGFQKLIQHMYLIKILHYLFLQALSMIAES